MTNETEVQEIKDNYSLRHCHHSYYEMMSSTPLMSHEETVNLFQKIQKGDLVAREKVIKSNFRLVFSIAHKFRNHLDVSFEDLIQEGNIGLLKSVERFEWEKGHRFSTYAIWWIKQSIAQFIFNKRIVRTPAHVGAIKRKLFKVLEEHKEKFGYEPDIDDLANLTGASSDIIRAALDTINPIVSLNQKVNNINHSSTNQMEYQDLIEDQNPNPYEILSRKETMAQVRKAFSKLSAKELIILKLRFGHNFGEENDDQYDINNNLFNHE